MRNISLGVDFTFHGFRSGSLSHWKVNSVRRLKEHFLSNESNVSYWSGSWILITLSLYMQRRGMMSLPVTYPS